MSWYFPLPMSFNLKLARGIRYLFAYILRLLRYVLSAAFLFTVGEYSRRRGLRSFLCYVVLPFFAVVFIAAGIWGWSNRIPKPESEPPHGFYRTILVHRIICPGLKLNQVEATPSYTELTCVWYRRSLTDDPPVISSKTSLVDQSGATYYVYRSEGLGLDRPIGVVRGHPVRVLLYFPPLPPGTEYVTLDFLAPGRFDSLSPQGLGKIWFNSPLQRFLSHFRK